VPEAFVTGGVLDDSVERDVLAHDDLSPVGSPSGWCCQRPSAAAAIGVLFADGAGASGSCAAVHGRIAIRRRRTVPMASAAKLFKRLKAARLDNTLDYEMRRLATVELLILDNFALQPLAATETADATWSRRWRSAETAGPARCPAPVERQLAGIAVLPGQ
jgi:hypothetical protein